MGKRNRKENRKKNKEKEQEKEQGKEQEREQGKEQGKMKEKRRKPGAYFTVEAAMVLPLVTAVLLFVIYFMIFQYNRCLMEQDAALLALRGINIQETDPERLEKAFRREAGRQDGKKYIAWRHTGTDMTLKGYKVMIHQSGRLKFNLERGWKAEISCGNTRIPPAFFLRSCRRLLKE